MFPDTRKLMVLFEDARTLKSKITLPSMCSTVKNDDFLTFEPIFSQPMIVVSAH